MYAENDNLTSVLNFISYINCSKMEIACCPTTEQIKLGAGSNVNNTIQNTILELCLASW